MLIHNLFSLFVDKFEELGINYIVVGSMASVVYGEPRLTHDIDLVVEIFEKDVQNLKNLFPDSQFYFPPNEVIFNELNRVERGHFNIIHHD